MEVCITLVALRHRLLDGHDNARAACKPLADAIAEELGMDDADPRIRWEYAQAETRGEEGVLVRVSAQVLGKKRHPNNRSTIQQKT